MNLADKYRPGTWQEVIGQRKVVEQIGLLRRTGLGGKAYWLSGSSGTGKTTIARLIAAEVATDFCTVEIDAGELTVGKLNDLVRTHRVYGLPPQKGHAVIVNESHGLRKDVIRRLLICLEDIRRHVAWIFTTTSAGQEQLFEDSIDAHPLLSRCHILALARKDLAEPFAHRCREIAELEGLNGRPLADYVRLAKDERNSMRSMLLAVEIGRMRN